MWQFKADRATSLPRVGSYRVRGGRGVICVWDSASGAAGASSGLDRGSLSNRLGGTEVGSLKSAHWRVSEFHFASGHIEVRASRADHDRRTSVAASIGDAIERNDGRVEKTDEERRSVNGSRARATVRRRAWGLDADRLVTLTRRGGFATRAECWEALQKWRRLCKSFSWWRDYIAVLEVHRGGGENDGKFHIHLGLRGFAPIRIAEKLWYKALGGTGNEVGSETPGNIDLGKQRDGNRVVPRGRIAWYLAKYVAKDFGADGTIRRGERAFSSSGCERGITLKRWVCALWNGGAPIAAFVRGLRASVRLKPGELRVFEWAADGERSEGFVIYALKS
jgi:hypothetical protein